MEYQKETLRQSTWDRIVIVIYQAIRKSFDSGLLQKRHFEDLLNILTAPCIEVPKNTIATYVGSLHRSGTA